MNEINSDPFNSSDTMFEEYKEAFKKIEIIKMLSNETAEQVWAKGESISLKAW